MKKVDKLPSFFCSQPFTYIYQNHNGYWKPCCKTDNWPSKDMSFEEYWYEDEDLYNLRMSFLTGEESEIKNKTCAICMDAESRGTRSHRQHTTDGMYDNSSLIKTVNNFLSTGYVLTNDPVFTFKVRAFGNTCNLKCYMCIPLNSTSRIAEMSKLNDESIQMFYPNHEEPRKRLLKDKNINMNVESEKNELLHALEDLQGNVCKINFAGGEPVLIKEYYELLDQLIERNLSKNIEVAMSSNLTHLKFRDKHISYYADKFKSLQIKASIDDIYERDEWIRYPSSFDKVIQNYKELEQIENCFMDVNVTWSLLNAANAENILDTLNDLSVKVTENSNFVTVPPQLHVCNHPNAIELSEKFSNSKYVQVRDVSKELRKKPVEGNFEKAIEYIKDLDRARKTKSWEIFTELSEFLKP